MAQSEVNREQEHEQDPGGGSGSGSGSGNSEGGSDNSGDNVIVVVMASAVACDSGVVVGTQGALWMWLAWLAGTVRAAGSVDTLTAMRRSCRVVGLQ